MTTRDGRYTTTRKSCPICGQPVRATQSTATITSDKLGLRHFSCVYPTPTRPENTA